MLAWKPTKSASFAEIEDVLLNVKKKLELADSKLDVICVCYEKSLRDSCEDLRIC